MQKVLNKNKMAKIGYLFGCLFLSAFVFSDSTFATGHTLSLTNSGDIEMTADPGYAATSTDSLEIVSTCPLGYTLTIEGANDTNLYRSGNPENRGEEDSQVIKSSTGTFSSPAELAENTWGYKLDANSSLYAGVTSEPVEILSSNEGTGDDPLLPRPFPIHYGAKLGTNLMVGQYKTDVDDAKSSVLYTLISEPACESAIFESGRYMNNLMVTGTEPETRQISLLPTNKSSSELKSFEEATTEEYEDAVADENIEIFEVQSQDSAYPIYLWFDTDIREVEQQVTDPDTGQTTTVTVDEAYNIGVNWFSEARNVYFNPDSSYFFNNMYTMDDIELSRIKGEKSQNLNFMFYRTARDTQNFSLVFPEDFDASSVQQSKNMFQGTCASTNQNTANTNKCSIKLNDTFNLENATTAQYMFSGAGEYYKEIEIDLGDNFNMKRATDVYSMFNGIGKYSYKTTINLGKNFNAESALNMNYMFNDGCRASTTYKNGICSIDLGDNFNAKSATRMDYMFTGYTAGELYSYNLNLGKNFNARSVTNMGYMFSGIGFSAKEVTIDLGDNFHPIDENSPADVNMSYMFSDVGANATEQFAFDFGEEFNTNNANNMSLMFSNFASKVPDFDITFPDTMVASHATNMSKMFQGICQNTTTSCSVTLNDTFNAENATDISYMFYRAGLNSSNFSLDLGADFDARAAKNMSASFALMGQKGEMTMDFGDNFRTDAATNMSNMFAGTGYKDPDFSLTLPSTFDASHVTNLSRMFQQTCRESSTSCTITINDSFKSIAAQDFSYMFAETAYLASMFSINLGANFDTSAAKNMSYMFQKMGYTAPTFSFDLKSKFYTANVTNMSYMFSEMGFTATNFTLDNFKTERFNTSNVQNMSYMFYRMAYSIPEFELELPVNFNTAAVTNMQAMFQETAYKATVSSIDFNDTFRTDAVKNMSYMFAGFGASAINFELILPAKINAHSATTLYGMFTETCSGVNKNSNSCKIKLDDNFKAELTTNIGFMFRSTGTYVKNVEIDLGNDFDAESVTSAGWFMQGACNDALVENCTVNFGDNFNVSKLKDFSSMFYVYGYRSFGESAKNVYLDLGANFNAAAATSMKNMFNNIGNNSTGSATIKLGDNFHPADSSLSLTMSGMFYGIAKKASPIIIDFGDNFDTSNVTDMSGMFAYAAMGAPNFNLVLPNKFVASKVTTMNQMFQNTCNRATISCSITFNDTLNASAVTDVESMFSGVGSGPINEVNIDLGANFNGSSITNYKKMFSSTAYGAQEFTIDLGDNFDTSSGQDMSYMFEYLGYTADDFSLSLGNHFDTSSAQNMSYMFREMAHSATTFVFNDFYDPQFNTANVTNMAYMFSYMAKSAPVLNLKLPVNFDTTNVTDMSYMFQGVGYSASVSSIDFGADFHTDNVKNMSYMFYEAGFSAIDYDLTLPDEFIASSATTLNNMFQSMCSGVAGTSTSCSLKVNDTFDAHSATNINYFLYYVGKDVENVSIDLGANFNVSAATSATRPVVGTCSGSSVRNCTLDYGDNFNISKLTNFATFHYQYNFTAFARDATGNISIDFGQNFNAESATDLSQFMYYVASSSTGTVSVDFGENFHPIKNGVSTKMNNFFTYFAQSANAIDLDWGDNFDTSNATDLRSFFQGAFRKVPELEVSLPNKFVASSASNISSMFQGVCYDSAISCKIKINDNFNANIATTAERMFESVGYNTPSIEIDLGSSFSTSGSITRTTSMFSSIGHNSCSVTQSDCAVAVIRLGNGFNTSGATNMDSMFIYVNLRSSNTLIDLGSQFSVASVTSTVSIFTGVGSSNLPSGQPDLLKIYTPSADIQTWVISKNSSRFNTSNVIVGSMPTSP